MTRFVDSRAFCDCLECEMVTIDDVMKKEIRACVAAGDPTHSFAAKFKYQHFLDKTVQMIYGTIVIMVFFRVVLQARLKRLISSSIGLSTISTRECWK